MVINCIICTSKIYVSQIKEQKQKILLPKCLQCFSSKNVLAKHKEVCLSINGAILVRLEIGTIGFKISSDKYQFHLKFMLILTVI